MTIHGAQQLMHRNLGQRPTTMGDRLIGKAQGIAHAALRRAGDKPQRRVLCRNSLRGHDALQMVRDMFGQIGL